MSVSPAGTPAWCGTDCRPRWCGSMLIG